MVYLVAGLVIFLGLHSLRIVAEGWRNQTLEGLAKVRTRRFIRCCRSLDWGSSFTALASPGRPRWRYGNRLLACAMQHHC